MEPASPKKLVKPLTIAGVLVVIAGIIGLTSLSKGASEAEQSAATSTDMNTPVTSAPTEIINPNKYKDGTYSAEGNYISPGGSEHVGVSITIKDDTVVASNFTIGAERPTSVQMQTQFASGYKQFVIGKKLDEVSVGKVSGSSLTPKGFNDAIAKIKIEAEA
ncbi:MAG: calcium-binding protein [Patescibacteria group bacterium]